MHCTFVRRVGLLFDNNSVKSFIKGLPAVANASSAISARFPLVSLSLDVLPTYTRTLVLSFYLSLHLFTYNYDETPLLCFVTLLMYTLVT
jgi:hypothetical protein